MKNWVLFNTSGFSEFLWKDHWWYRAAKMRKIFFKNQFKDIDFELLKSIANWFSDTYKLDLMPLVPNIRVAPSLADSKWSTGLTIFDDNRIDILLCWYSIRDVTVLYSTIFHELVHANSYTYSDITHWVTRAWFTQYIGGSRYHTGIDEGMTDMLAWELFKKYCAIKELPYIYEYCYIREIWKVKRLIVFLSKKCGISQEDIKKILYSWYFNGIHKNKDGIWKSIYKVLSDSNGEFKLTDAEIIRILDDTLN